VKNACYPEKLKPAEPETHRPTNHAVLFFFSFAEMLASRTVELQSNNNTMKDHSVEFFNGIVRDMKPDERVVFVTGQGALDKQELMSTLKLAGFVKISENTEGIEAFKPSYELGSVSLLKRKPKAVELDDDLIDEDTLLDEKDLVRPSVESLQNPSAGCETKKKACKDCTCGRAEQERLEKITLQNVPQEAPKSNCNRCPLGDAYRCSTCPYLGMPAFQVSDGKIVLSLDDSADI
jgi:hypothetical protein